MIILKEEIKTDCSYFSKLIIILFYIACLALLFLLFWYYFLRQNKGEDNENIENYSYQDDIYDIDDDISSTETFVSKINNNVNKYKIDSLYHNDYTYLMTAIKNLTPSKEHIFNSGNLPITQNKGSKKEVMKLIKDYVNALNLEIINMDDTLNQNSGWDENLPHNPKSYKSGWDKTQEKLGFPKLWKDSAGKGKILLIDIANVYKEETDDEIKYFINFILGQSNVRDQIILSGEFVKNMRDLRNEDNFHEQRPTNIPIFIENVFVSGFLTNKNTGMIYENENEIVDDLNKNITTKKIINKALKERHNERLNDAQYRTANLDLEGRAFYSDVY